MRKYEITDIQHPDNARLHRIKALIDILRWGVKAGDLGGYIQSESNLSQIGDCWVYGFYRDSGFWSALSCAGCSPTRFLLLF